MGYSNFTIFAMYSLIVFFGGYEVDSGRATFEQLLKAFLCVMFAALGLAQAQVRWDAVDGMQLLVLLLLPLLLLKLLLLLLLG